MREENHGRSLSVGRHRRDRRRDCRVLRRGDGSRPSQRRSILVAGPAGTLRRPDHPQWDSPLRLPHPAGVELQKQRTANSGSVRVSEPASESCGHSGKPRPWVSRNTSCNLSWSLSRVWSCSSSTTYSSPRRSGLTWADWLAISASPSLHPVHADIQFTRMIVPRTPAGDVAD